MNRRIVPTLAGSLLLLAPALAGCSGDADAPADVAAVEAAADAPVAVAFDGAHVDQEAFVAALDAPGVVLIDVRTPEEFASGHLPGALNIDINSATFAQNVAALDPEADYAVYCRSANRSRAAIDVMTEQGIAHTVGLEGGIVAWTGDVVTG
ncbi:rhodanese-like domain-containing protein [Demequina pelophila]|uniref:rhodanese-like domain-containing protein n=1 Tax=Demequina pelophila TaxID=1638984 RepID=UPI0009E503D9|nr:rhodanese-like domain-containing protein [Demequina pelophila]